MKVDETIDSINRIWLETSVIVFVHAVALGLAIAAGMISTHTLAAETRSLAYTPELASFRSNLQRIGLDLPFVAGTALVAYIVIFQRFSSIVVQLPLFRTKYSQPALWRAAKCFDELLQLAKWFQGFTASLELADLEVTLNLAVTQNSKEYKEHYQELVGDRFESAALWTRYYSGFCLLAVASLFFISIDHHGLGSLLLPAGLTFAAFVARCGWESQIERAVLGRLQFAIDCGVVSGADRDKDQENAARTSSARDAANGPRSQRDEVWEKLFLQLASELLKLPPPYLPYQHYWGLHYVRYIWPFKGVGALPMVRNELFRYWMRDSALATPDSVSLMDEEWRTIKELHEMIERPTLLPDDRLIVRLLRSRVSIRFSKLASRTVLVDDIIAYQRSDEETKRLEAARSPRRETFRKWMARWKREHARSR
jgi:hypothetical protein